MSGGYRIAFTHVPRRQALEKTPVLFLHGGPGGYVHSSAVRTLGRLAALGHDVYLYDQVGSGLSDRLPRPKDYSFLGHVRDLHEIVTRRLGLSRVILIGHSYGGVLAAQFAATYPGLVDRLVLSSPGDLQPALFTDDGRWINETKYVPPPTLRFVEVDSVPMDGIRFWPARALASMAIAQVFNVKLMSDTEADGVLNTLATRFTRNGVCDPAHVQPEEGGAGFYAHGGGNWFGDLDDPRPALRACPAPVLVLQGSCDFIPYAATYEYVDLMPHARYVFIEGAGHVIWWDKPVEYVEEIARFLSENPGDR
jgi:pimeloyl-ACP methyl ester carboxylesterase